ncbi:isoprenylcysteine carboxylmethyltransferase family protein [Actinocrispum sp. NPDC049592]|uniref:methyltransferase family protein n=1 Tax=Actinocrispum sp. NPDC049592 TaxID=3154835 RepID=UPI003441D251
MRNRVVAAVGSAVFFVLAPGIVAGLLPWLITGWVFEPVWPPLRVLGWVVLVPSVAVLVAAFIRFVVEGIGTPAPIAPPRNLVVGGLYRYVRNPMYLCVLGAIVGQALVFGQPWVFLYAAAVSGAFFAMVHWHEEPSLARNFGSQYETYRDAVPGWLPRLKPWQPPSAPS